MFQTPKTLIIKTLLILLQELFVACNNQLADNFIFQMELQIMKKIFSVKIIIQNEAKKAYNNLIMNCIKDGLIVAVCQETVNKDNNISDLSFKALETIFETSGNRIQTFSEQSYEYIFKSLVVGLKGQRKTNMTISKKLIRILY